MTHISAKCLAQYMNEILTTIQNLQKLTVLTLTLSGTPFELIKTEMGAVFSISGEISNHNCLQYTNLVTSALPPSPYYGYFLDLKNSAIGRSK